MAQELLGELIREGKNQNPSRLALVWRDQAISYFNLDGQIDQVADSFLRRGVQHFDRIALYMHNLPQFVIAYYALQRIGAVAVPINIYWRGRDLRYLLEQSAVSGVITIAPLFERVQEELENLPNIKWVVAISGSGPQPHGSEAWEDLFSGPLTDPVSVETDAVEPALIAFTGGRKGPSRPVLLSHFNLLANCQQMQDLPQVQFYGAERDEQEEDTSPTFQLPSANSYEVALLPLPLSNLFSLNIGLNLTYMLGGTAVLMEKFDPAQALALIEEQSCTLVYGSPAIFTELVNAPEWAEADLSSLRYAFSYGDTLPEKVVADWQKKTKTPLFNCYGVTEASPLLCCDAAGEKRSPGSVGSGLPMVQLYLQGAAGDDLPAGQAGELLAKGPNLMLGYFNPAEPEQPFSGKSEGWFATSDLAQCQEDDSFQIIDRKEDALMLPSGELLVPRDIEQVLCTHPGVWETAALPYTTKDGRNRMVAFVVLNESGRSLTEPQLTFYCDRRLPAAHTPERIFIFREESLPRLPNGAVWRRALRTIIPSYL